MSDLSIFSNYGSVLDAVKRSMHHLVPPPDILPSKWAEKNIKIPVGNAIPGPINFDNAPSLLYIAQIKSETSDLDSLLSVTLTIFP